MMAPRQVFVSGVFSSPVLLLCAINAAKSEPSDTQMVVALSLAQGEID
jgi:hypothetical protein